MTVALHATNDATFCQSRYLKKKCCARTLTACRQSVTRRLALCKDWRCLVIFQRYKRRKICGRQVCWDSSKGRSGGRQLPAVCQLWLPVHCPLNQLVTLAALPVVLLVEAHLQADVERLAGSGQHLSSSFSQPPRSCVDQTC